MRIGQVRAVSLLAVGLSLAVPATRADGEPGEPEPGVPLALGECLPSSAPARLERAHGRGCARRAAYSLSHFLSLEGIREPLDEVAPQTSGDAPTPGDLRTESYTVNGRLVAGLGRVRPYVSGGLGVLEASGDLRVGGARIDGGGFDLAARFGGGLDLRATDRISLFVDTAYTIAAAGDGIREGHYLRLGWGARYLF